MIMHKICNNKVRSSEWRQAMISLIYKKKKKLILQNVHAHLQTGLGFGVEFGGRSIVGEADVPATTRQSVHLKNLVFFFSKIKIKNIFFLDYVKSGYSQSCLKI